MTAKLSLLNRRLVIEAGANDPKELFKQLGQVAEIFEADTCCGACGSLEIRPNCRTVDSYDYYSLHCSACGAELTFGQRKDGGLFAKRKDDSGNCLEDNGWRRYKSQRAIEASTAAAVRKSRCAYCTVRKRDRLASI